MLGGHGRGRGGGGGHHREADRYEEQVEPLSITDRRMLAWFAAYLGPHWPKLLLGLISMLAATAASLYYPQILKQIYDDVIAAGDLGPLPRLGWLLLATFFAMELFRAVRMNVMHQLGQRFVLDVRLNAYRHLLRQPLEFFETRRTGDIMSRISNDVNAVEDMVVHGVDTLISDSITVIATIAIILWMNTHLALVGMAPLPIFVVGIVIFGRIIRPLYEHIREKLGDINARLQESLEGTQVVKAFNREEHEYGRFADESTDYFRSNVRGIWLWTTFFPAMGFITSIGLILVIWRGAAMTTTGLVTGGDVLAFLAYMQHFYQPIGSLVRVHNVFNRALASLARIFQLLDEEPKIKEKPDAIELPEVEGHVELDDITFRYSTGEIVLEHVSVTAEPGETVAIVGRSGAGKTSLVNLIPRFYDPQEGRVLVDGHDVRDVKLDSLRSQIGIVLQDTFLFNDTVRNNIRYGRIDATDEEIEEAAERAYAWEFIKDLSEQYDTMIGERGVKLSGGQKQRIAIARALLADPRILILDEATSLVDTEAEQLIQRALDNLRHNRTTFVIAHRLSTVRDADKILVIQGGQIVEEDNHEQLMARNGVYAEMYNRQFRLQDVWFGQGRPDFAGPPEE
ncbi:MAG: ABC transporter ATP-binding protein [candidate division WS1 bacterium]|jgi:ABC-type multidrug transport system fused ATPase/permease subunit|nr:ABC transporter ATP-binding protein [candidate division WS1 bacterium]